MVVIVSRDIIIMVAMSLEGWGIVVVVKFPKVCGRWYGLVNVGKMFPSIVLGGFAFVGAGCRSLTMNW